MIASSVRDSMLLDVAHLQRGVPAAIEQLTADSLKELDHARERAERDATGKNDAATL